jgi:hypothetical protein
MVKQFGLAMLMACMSVLVSTPAFADPGGIPHWASAPEPVTTVGLLLGAGGIAAARWAKGRKRTPKP